MPTYIGFSTQQLEQVRTPQYSVGVDGGSGSITKPLQITKKFRLVDQELVLQDFINALNIPQGQLPGKPEVGTTIWSFIFEQNNLDLQIQIENEVKRVAKSDPRLILNTVVSYPQDQGILVEVEVAVTPYNVSQQLAIMFNQDSGTASGTATSANGTSVQLNSSTF